MSTCLLALALVAGCVAAPDPEPTTPSVDHWVAEDKLRHFALSFAATQTAYGGLTLIADPDAAMTGAATTGLALGLAKELHDLRSGRAFSLKDLAWDAAGVALATALVRQIR